MKICLNRFGSSKTTKSGKAEAQNIANHPKQPQTTSPRTNNHAHTQAIPSRRPSGSQPPFWFAWSFSPFHPASPSSRSCSSPFSPCAQPGCFSASCCPRGFSASQSQPQPQPQSCPLCSAGQRRQARRGRRSGRAKCLREGCRQGHKRNNPRDRRAHQPNRRQSHGEDRHRLCLSRPR